MDSKEMVNTLAIHPFFTHLSLRHLHALVACAQETRFNAYQYMLTEGDPATAFYLLLAGEVSLSNRMATRGVVNLHRLRAQDILGWSWLFEPYTWHYDARANTAVVTLEFDAAQVRQLCEQDCELGYHLVKRFAGLMLQRLQISRLQLLNLSSEPL